MRHAKAIVDASFVQAPNQGESLFIESGQIVCFAPPNTVHLAHYEFAVAVYEYPCILHGSSMLKDRQGSLILRLIVSRAIQVDSDAGDDNIFVPQYSAKSPPKDADLAPFCLREAPSKK
jgi:hypothetical protein